MERNHEKLGFPSPKFIPNVFALQFAFAFACWKLWQIMTNGTSLSLWKPRRLSQSILSLFYFICDHKQIFLSQPRNKTNNIHSLKKKKKKKKKGKTNKMKVLSKT